MPARQPETKEDKEIAQDHQLLYSSGFRFVLVQSVSRRKRALLVFQPSLKPDYINDSTPRQGSLSIDSLRRLDSLVGPGVLTSKSAEDSLDVAVKIDLPFVDRKESFSWPGQVVVVGGGVAGLQAACKLAEAGRHVLLLEAANYIGKETFVVLSCSK